MRHSTTISIGAALMAMSTAAQAATFQFNTNPFDGTTILSIPGRQIVGGELFINFNPSTDVFSFDSSAFNMGNAIGFVNGIASGIPSTGVNTVVLESFDNDNNPLTPFGAGNAADLIADHVTTSGPGVFIYFNQSLNLARLVYSSDLSSHNSDLRILARMLNLFGPSGQNQLPNFTAANFAMTNAASPVPEPSAMSMMGIGLTTAGCYVLRRRRARV